MIQQENKLSDMLTPGQQLALVGHCLLEEVFFLKCLQYIKPEWLSSDIIAAHIYKQIVQFYQEHKRIPQSGEELLAEPFFTSQKSEDYQKYRAVLMAAMEQTANHPLDVLRPKLTSFVKLMSFKGEVKEALVHLNKHNIDKSANTLAHAVKVYNEIEFDKREAVDFSDSINAFTKKAEEEFISTGSKTLDSMLGGGLVRGENLAVLAPTFTGKSRYLITLIRHLLVDNRKVLFITHEDNPEKIKKRIISAVVGIGVYELTCYLRNEGVMMPAFPNGTKGNLKVHELGNLNTEDGRQLYEAVVSEIKRAIELIEKNLTFIHWVKSGQMYVENVLAEARRLHLELKAKNGMGFDVFIDDYPQKLETRTKHELTRSKIAYVYEQFNVFAGEMNIAMVYAVQVNRNAAKQMKSGEAESSVSLEDVGEAYAVSQNANMAVSLNRNPDDVQAGVLRIAVIKARDNSQNQMLFTRSAYNECVLYGDGEKFTTYGQSLIKGLTGLQMLQTAKDTGTLLANLEQIETDKDYSVELANRVTASRVPQIIKKIKGLPGA